MLMRETFDRFYPTAQGENVLASLEPEGEVKAQVMICGHHDSAPEFTFFTHLPRLYPLRLGGAFISYILLVLASLWFGYKHMYGLPPNLQFAITLFLTFLLVFTLPLWWFLGSKDVLGAGDNLASSAVAIAIGNHFSQLRHAKKGLQHTRLIVASWDAEESGLRGSRAFANANQNLLGAVPTYVLNLECLFNADELLLLTRDISGFVTLSKPLVARIQKLAVKEGINLKTASIPFMGGATDAAEFALVGCEATTLLGLDFRTATRSPLYHTPNDILKRVSPQAIESTLTICTRLAEEIDREVAS